MSEPETFHCRHYRSVSGTDIFVVYFPMGIPWEWQWTLCGPGTGNGDEEEKI